MSENLYEQKIREKNEITIPIPVRKYLNLGVNDWIRWIKDKGEIKLIKITTRAVPNNYNNDGGENGSNKTD